MASPAFDLAAVLLAVIVGAAIGVVITVLWYKKQSEGFRARHEIPSLIGTWRCQWFDDASSGAGPKIEDTVEVVRWTRNSEFVGEGHQPQFQLSYPVAGEIDPSRVVTLVYRAARYPFEPNRGVACLELARDGLTMEGRWFGRRFSNQFGGGRVRCERVVQSAA